MGFFLSRLWQKFEDREVRILILGLDAAGKTTLLYKLKTAEVVSTVPTIGFNVEAVRHKNINFTAWDVGGQDKIRLLWRHFYADTQGIIFVVESNNPDRFDEARDELSKVLTDDQLRDTPVLVLANKQDLPQVATPAQLAEHFELHSVIGRKWYVQGSCAISGDGLVEGLDWLAKNINP